MQAAHKRFPTYEPLFELSVQNADKGFIQEEIVSQRAAQFQDRRLALTHAPLFSQKAKLFPESVFVIGYDTYVRLIDPKYYNHSVD